MLGNAAMLDSGGHTPDARSPVSAGCQPLVLALEEVLLVRFPVILCSGVYSEGWKGRVSLIYGGFQRNTDSSNCPMSIDLLHIHSFMLGLA